MRTARIKGRPGSCYHCMSRILERRFLLGDHEKEVFRKILRATEEFCGVRLLTYAIMSNHFHLLVEVPSQPKLSDTELIDRLAALYPKAQVRVVAESLRRLRAEGQDAEAERLRAGYLYRMGDLSEFIKTLKQRFTQWYNRRHGRRGTLWEERFKSVLVEGRGHALATMAAYIDLNPVRAGLVCDPGAYRYSGYGEALGGSALARAGLGAVMESLGGRSGWRWAGPRYREHLHVQGERREGRAGVSPAGVKAVLDAGGRLSAGQLLRCRVRYFSDGVVLGSREFVEGVFAAHREHFGPKRKTGARPLRQTTLGDLFTARDLRLEVITVPGG